MPVSQNTPFCSLFSPPEFLLPRPMRNASLPVQSTPPSVTAKYADMESSHLFSSISAPSVVCFQIVILLGQRPAASLAVQVPQRVDFVVVVIMVNALSLDLGNHLKSSRLHKKAAK